LPNTEVTREAPSPDGHSKLDPLHALGGHGLCFLSVPASHGFRGMHMRVIVDLMNLTRFYLEASWAFISCISHAYTPTTPHEDLMSVVELDWPKPMSMCPFRQQFAISLGRVEYDVVWKLKAENHRPPPGPCVTLRKATLHHSPHFSRWSSNSHWHSKTKCGDISLQLL
jgi:hypothetical protein